MNIFKRIFRKILHLHSSRKIEQTNSNRKNAEQYFRSVVEPYLDAACPADVRPYYEVLFNGFALSVYAELHPNKHGRSRTRPYLFVHNGSTISENTSGREMSKTEFEKFIEGIFRHHSVTPRE